MEWPLVADFVAEVGDDGGEGRGRGLFDGVVRHLAASEADNCFRCPWVTQDLRKVLLCGWRRSHQKFGEPPEVLSDSGQRELKLGAPWAP